MRRGQAERRCGCGVRVRDAVTGGGRCLGLSVTVDLQPLSTVGELHAVVAGLSTYTWHTVSQELHHRTPWTIRTRPAGSRPRQQVLPAHRCGHAWQADTDHARPVPGVHAPETDDAPPF